ncbi:class I SAM-dependent methyltransferase [Deinococcus wulumuqiensis]|uniref:Methyltransferase type 11 domain-containing protein n=1 Tax=Deinococcus wulumuqiensis TaxID=980427 RepID=A0AAV4K717_9DEIO|nr:class I SAM-dependent methyltransferase [Deinococcus wulumuqiensis]QII21378.1 class I SAM-dependent methyltransferase [Deinococcus wulumuqiensis R12]GGI82981.1 hypothetical protein GCM10010914_16570 [Deinococcus wulumuqiensis]GGP29524.1 hypothetical protein GCM10008021_11750 [Deinococcus wulumuqiensis]
MPLTAAQRSNFFSLTAWAYPLWRARSLTLLAGEPFGLAREARLFLGLCRPAAGERWLDVGTSTGFYAGVLARAGCRVVAADLSPVMLHAAARREPRPQIEWVQANLESTDWRPARFDGVVVGATLNETADPWRLLRSGERLLRPGGQLWLMFVPRTGGPLQGLLSRLGGLTFPDLSAVEAALPGCTLVHARRAGQVQFARFVRGGGSASAGRL